MIASLLKKVWVDDPAPLPALPAAMVPIPSKLTRYRGRSRLPDHHGWRLARIKRA
jgi:hypothetical protein